MGPYNDFTTVLYIVLIEKMFNWIIKARVSTAKTSTGGSQDHSCMSIINIPLLHEHFKGSGAVESKNMFS